MPSSPKTANEVITSFANAEIMASFGSTAKSHGIKSSPFLKKIVIEQGFAFAYVVFASDTIIAHVAELPSEHRHIALDGTFKVTPDSDFKQLLIIHVEFFQKVFI